MSTPPVSIVSQMSAIERAINRLPVTAQKLKPSQRKLHWSYSALPPERNICKAQAFNRKALPTVGPF